MRRRGQQLMSHALKLFAAAFSMNLTTKGFTSDQPALVPSSRLCLSGQGPRHDGASESNASCCMCSYERPFTACCHSCKLRARVVTDPGGSGRDLSLRVSIKPSCQGDLVHTGSNALQSAGAHSADASKADGSSPILDPACIM